MAILQVRQQEMYVGIAMVEGNIMTATNKRQYDLLLVVNQETLLALTSTCR